MTVIRVGNGIFGQGMPNRITGPSTSHMSSATLFKVLSGA
jgi:hypothetical protein